MDLDAPLHLTPMVRAWACRLRGLCCKHYKIQIADIERRRIERRLGELGDARAADFASDTIVRDGAYAALPMVNNACTFLGGDDLCKLRTGLGDRYLPDACRKFPYLSLHTGERHVIGLTFYCPTALQLLASEARFDVQVEVGTEPPTNSVAWLGNDDRVCFGLAGDEVPVGEFWARHWDLFARFRARPEPDPLERLVAFAEEATGEAAGAPAVLPRPLFKQGAFEPAVERELARLTGEVPPGLPSLWLHLPPQDYTLDPLPEPDERDLVLRYLLHRMACPSFYVVHTDLRYLLTVLFGMVARYRIERERGFAVLAAVRQLDRFFLHSTAAATLHDSRSTFAAWRAMASLARAVTVG